MKKKLITVLLTCSMVVGTLCACGDTEDSSSKKDRTEDSDEEEEEDEDKDEKKDKEEGKAVSEKISVLAGTEWEEEPWMYDPWTGTTAGTTEPEPQVTPAPEPIPEPEPENPEGVMLYIDPATGKPYDLGGMEIVIRDWWSSPDQYPTNEYEEARMEYVDWLEETYNFTITQMAISDWASAPTDFIDYVTTGGDDVNYVFVLRDDPATTSAARFGLMYDLSTLDCLDFSEVKFQRNKTHEQYSYESNIYAMYTGYSEPRTGMFFNKRLLTEAGIDPEYIYDMQAEGTWTWDAWTDIMSKVQRDIDGDGITDVYGFDANYSVPINAAVYSNNGEYVGLENGKYVYKFEDSPTVDALVWITNCMKYYGLVRPADAQWDYYKEAFINGECAFMVEDAYFGGAGGVLAQEMTDEVGFVMFPKGPYAEDYTNCWTNNPVAIPACYDADRAWLIAFAYDLYTDDVPGYEDYLDMSYYHNGILDFRAVDETLPMMMEKGMVTYHSMIPNLDINAPFLWNFYGGCDVMAILDSIRVPFNEWINEANQ